jgi:DNA-directed RNA polymerase subunit F
MVNICVDVPPETHAKLRVIMAQQGFRSLKELLKYVVTQYAETYYSPSTSPSAGGR